MNDSLPPSQTASKERLLLDFVETAGVGLHWVGADGTILWANPADYEPLGYQSHEYVGHNITEFHADSETISDILARLTRGERLRDYEARLRCKDGSIRSVIISSSVLFDEQGRFVHTRCFTHDITERKRIEETKEQFVSILGHDLRNPLSAISVGARFLLTQGDLTDAHRHTAVRISRAADRMSRMIADLLDFTRVRLGEGIPVNRTGADLRSIAQQAIDELQAGNPLATITLTVDGDMKGCWDPDRMAQVISNLVGNGLEHGDGPVSVALRGTADAVLMDVSNTGPSIPAAALATICDPFCHRRADSTRRTGLGLGLFISSEIVRSHGGKIDVQSNLTATTVRVEWPRN